MATNFRQLRIVKERRQKIYGALFLMALIFLFGRGAILGTIGRIGHLVGLPFWHAANIVEDNTAALAEAVRPKSSIIAENIALRARIEESDLGSTTIAAVMAENAHLKELMGRTDTNKTILARVLSRPPFEVYDTFVIDVGSREGVKEGALVYGKGQFVIGTVTRVMYASAVVTLASAPGETRSVMVAESAEGDPAASSSIDQLSQDHELVFTGIGGGGFRTQVPKQLRIAMGTPMALPTLEPSFIGIVTAEYVPHDGSLKEIYGTLPFGINSLEWVKVSIPEALPGIQ